MGRPKKRIVLLSDRADLAFAMNTMWPWAAVRRTGMVTEDLLQAREESTELTMIDATGHTERVSRFLKLAGANCPQILILGNVGDLAAGNETIFEFDGKHLRATETRAKILCTRHRGPKPNRIEVAA